MSLCQRGGCWRAALPRGQRCELKSWDEPKWPPARSGPETARRPEIKSSLYFRDLRALGSPTSPLMPKTGQSGANCSHKRLYEELGPTGVRAHPLHRQAVSRRSTRKSLSSTPRLGSCHHTTGQLGRQAHCGEVHCCPRWVHHGAPAASTIPSGVHSNQAPSRTEPLHAVARHIVRLLCRGGGMGTPPARCSG